MKKRNYLSYILLILLLIFSFKVKAQEEAGNCCKELLLGSFTTQNVLAEAFYNVHPALDGQYYLKWLSGTIYYTDGRIISSQILRYHGYSDNIHWQRQSDKQVGAIPKKAIEKIIIYTEGQESIMFRKVALKLPLSFEVQDVFLEILNQGDLELCCYRKVKFIKNSEQGFYPDFQYYIKKGDDYKSVKLSKSGLLSQFDKEEKEKIKKTIKENKLKVSHEADMVKAITLINREHNE